MSGVTAQTTRHTSFLMSATLSLISAPAPASAGTRPGCSLRLDRPAPFCHREGSGGCRRDDEGGVRQHHEGDVPVPMKGRRSVVRDLDVSCETVPGHRQACRGPRAPLPCHVHHRTKSTFVKHAPQGPRPSGEGPRQWPLAMKVLDRLPTRPRRRSPKPASIAVPARPHLGLLAQHAAAA
jgi:hypothetical protein